jgi:peptidoglycan hydrolase-like protein with peptidoglycan-binding domain
MATGSLQVQTFVEGTYIPVNNARVTVTESFTRNTRQIPEVLTTNTAGLTDDIDVPAPPIEFSMAPTNALPYSLYNVRIEVDGFIDVVINGVQVFPNELALQQVELTPVRSMRQLEPRVITIQPNTLIGNFPPKIPEDPEKPLPPPPTGFVVLPEPVVPELIVVHAGRPDDPAPNYTVRYKDYIKNVASSEIYATWTENTIRANVYCIISFTLNRIYTEWYRGKGKNFDVTNSTAFDQAFSFGRNIYESISRVVDEIFSTYVKRPGAKQPLLTQYCDGVQVQCPGWLTQWGSKYLGDQGRTPYEILTNFYGTNLNLETAPVVAGIPMSFPGFALSLGTRGEPVRTIQTYLNRISNNFPLIPKMAVDGVFGEATRNAVLVFQEVFKLPQTGVVEYATWYRISDIYVAVTGIAELQPRDGNSRMRTFVPPASTFYRGTSIPTIQFPDDKPLWSAYR